MSVVGDGTPAQAAPLRVAVGNAPSDLRTLVIQKRDGSHVLALWRLASVWNRDERVPITVDPVRIVVRLPAANSVRAIEPMSSTTETQLELHNHGVEVELDGDPILLHVVE
jgi:hypothetical protein